MSSLIIHFSDIVRAYYVPDEIPACNSSESDYETGCSMTEALHQCIEQHADIAHVTTPTELDAVNEFLSTYPKTDQKLWIGLRMVYD